MHATDYVFGSNFHLFKGTLEDLLLERSQCCLLFNACRWVDSKSKWHKDDFPLVRACFCWVLRSDLALKQNKAKTSRNVTQIVFFGGGNLNPSTFCLDEQLQIIKKTKKKTSGSEGIVIVELWFHLAGLGMPASLHLLCISFPESDCSVDCAQMEGRHREHK